MSQHTELIDELRKSSASDSAWNLGILCQRAADALQAMERVPLTRSQKNRIWSSCSGAKTLPARASLFGTKLEAHHNITQPESKG